MIPDTGKLYKSKHFEHNTDQSDAHKAHNLPLQFMYNMSFLWVGATTKMIEGSLHHHHRIQKTIGGY